MLTLAMMFVAGCKPEDTPNNGSGNNGNDDSDVRVTTYMPQDITGTTAKCGGDVIVIQGLSLSELGVCWSKEQNPTIENAHVFTTNWREPYVCTITDLEPETKYYVRAYALRGLEYYYGEEVVFTTIGVDLPTVITTEATNITSNSAKGGGVVSSEGSCPVIERGICWSINPNPTIDDAHISSGNGVGTFEVIIDSLWGNRKYYVRAYAENCNGICYGSQVSFTTSPSIYNGHEYVDLGLPSGTLWATCNVGASLPEDYGDYFAWGETTPKTFFGWSNYRYCNGASNQLTKYCTSSDDGFNGFTDNLTILQPSDDAATANWGDGWCMPTRDQWRELKDNTNSVWTTKNGVIGRLLTATNGGSIFLPAAGLGEANGLYNCGSYGSYWSSHLIGYSPAAAYGFDFNFNSDLYGEHYGMRDGGQSVRAVRSTRQN